MRFAHAMSIEIQIDSKGVENFTPFFYAIQPNTNHKHKNMITFIEHLKCELDKKLQPILSADLNIMRKSHDASLVYADAFKQLKNFIAGYTFRDDAEEIHFFKEIKPRLYFGLIYYNIEMNRPEGVESQRAYLIDEIKVINRYNSKRSDFVRYYRSGLTHLDSIYYLRGHADVALYLDSFYYERDPMFSTNCDFTVARLLANESLTEYLNKELDVLENHWLSQSLPRVRITWSAQKMDLYELIFAARKSKSIWECSHDTACRISYRFSISNWTRIYLAASAICVFATDKLHFSTA